MAYGLNEEQAEAIVEDGYQKFVKFVEHVTQWVRTNELKVENSQAYIIGPYQRMGVILKAK